jgi:glycerol-3-phosphate acyltransferase PlsY
MFQSLSETYAALNPFPLAGLCLLAYLLGSIPFGLLIARTFRGLDPREAGSRNVGATNVARLCGFRYGALVLVCDALKGLLPTWLALRLGLPPLLASLAGLCALLGHLFSIFLRFKGGKAVSTTIGVFIPLSFPALLLSALICILLIWRSGYVSLGSLGLAASLPVCLAVFGRYELLPLALLTLLIIFTRHRENIKRLLAGEEKSWRKSRSGKEKQ